MGGEGSEALINKNNGVLCGPLSRLAAHNRFHHTAGFVKSYQVCVCLCLRASVCETNCEIIFQVRQPSLSGKPL